MTVLDTYRRYARRRYRRAAGSRARLDIQGLRMVAVLTVFANHLWGWPRGGFVGVDVFFVISGFLITGNLLRTAEITGKVSFGRFYWNRVRRIAPAATVVLILTCLAAAAVFVPLRAQSVRVDAIFASIFMANWWFVVEGTDYFRAAATTVSPIQHYWSLSIEEQFYFVWPALIFLISSAVVRRAWTHTHRMRLAGSVMSVMIVASLVWAMLETAHSPTWAYFDTFARVWELGVGALLATTIGILARIPEVARPVLSWTGLGLIGASLVLIGEESRGFPAPWALLPVVGAALVIAAGVGGEPRWQTFLRNPISTYVGDISYSLYLVHWPVIVVLGGVMEHRGAYFLSAVMLSLALAITSYHFLENPLRRADLGKLRKTVRDIRRGHFYLQRSSQYAAVGALALLVAGLIPYVVRPQTHHYRDSPTAASATTADPTPKSMLGPLGSALRSELDDALKATEWPALNPSMESVLRGGLMQRPDVARCSGDETLTDPTLCNWGDAAAPIRVLIVGDSVALGYAGAFRDIALNSGGRIQVQSQAMGSCAFADDLLERLPQVAPNCSARNTAVVDMINATGPSVVVISNLYRLVSIVGTSNQLGPREISASVGRIVERFRHNVGKVVILSPPPGDANIRECSSTRASEPADCIGKVTQDWNDLAFSDQELVNRIGGAWIDSRPWFCSHGFCPAFAGVTPTKVDASHIAPPYGSKIHPVIAESFQQAGVF